VRLRAVLRAGLREGSASLGLEVVTDVARVLHGKDQTHTVAKLTKRLASLGYEVELRPAA
jgi:hypothetical protein